MMSMTCRHLFNFHFLFLAKNNSVHNHIANWFVSKQSTAARRSLALAVVLTGLSESQKKPLLGTRIIIRITAYSAGVPLALSIF